MYVCMYVFKFMYVCTMINSIQKTHLAFLWHCMYVWKHVRILHIRAKHINLSYNRQRRRAERGVESQARIAIEEAAQ
jgi:hypothetical protein